MSAHTPGPWVAERKYDGHSTVAQMRSCDRTVCVNATDDASPCGHEATDANARLIAAAPDMLEALREVQAFMDTPLGQRADPARACRLVLAAIAKAEGRTT